MPFKTAIKLPVFIYGRVRLFGLNGRVRFENTEVRTGMVQIGINAESFQSFDHSSFIQLASRNSLIIFNGGGRISVNSKVRVVDGTLTFGKNFLIGTGSAIYCNGGKISIGDFSRITFGCILMNSSFHYTYDTVKGCYHNRTSNIEIGALNWIGNHTTMMGGCKTKTRTIAGAGSLLNKDYAAMDGDFPTLVGRPAKVIRTGVKRVFSPKTEEQVSQLFASARSEVQYVESTEIEDNPSDLANEARRIWM